MWLWEKLIFYKLALCNSVIAPLAWGNKLHEREALLSRRFSYKVWRAVLYTYIIQLYIYTYICWIHTDAMNKQTSEDFFKKIYLSLYCKVCVWEGVGDQTELQYIDPHSYGHQRCVFLVLLMLNWGPTLLAFSTASYHQLVWSPNSIGGPKGPLCWVVAFPTTSFLQLIWSPTHWLPVFTKLYNSSIAHSIFGMVCLIIIKRK